jgi:hypothetical protein
MYYYIITITYLLIICYIFEWLLLLVCRQKAFQKREDAAVRARQNLEAEQTRELADKLQESSFVADPEEPLEL